MKRRKIKQTEIACYQVALFSTDNVDTPALIDIDNFKKIMLVEFDTAAPLFWIDRR